MEKCSINSSRHNILPCCLDKAFIKKSTKYHDGVQRMVSSSEIHNEMYPQGNSQSSENISIGSRTTSHTFAAKLLKDSKPVDIIYKFLDLSKKPIEDIKDFFKISSAKYWAEEYIRHKKEGKILSMPGMAETTKKIKKVIADFKTLYKNMKLKDSEALTILQCALDINADNGYPSYDSELLAKKFCVLRDLLVLRYGEQGDPQWPKETDLGYFISDFGKLKTNLSKLVGCSHEILRDDFSTDRPDYQDIHLRYPFYSEFVRNIERHYKNHFRCTDTVRILVMDDLCLEDFNQTTGMPITYLGLLQDTSIARHDNLVFLSYPLLIHDGYHGNICLSLNSRNKKDIIYSVMSEYYNKVKPALNNSVAQIVEHMFFATLHESPNFFEEDSTMLALIDIFDGVGITRNKYKTYDDKYLTHSFNSNLKLRKEDATMIYHLTNATDVACHAIKIFTFFSSEAKSALNNKQTGINKLVRATKSENDNLAKHSIESLSQIISDDEINKIKQHDLRCFLDQIEEPRKQLLFKAIADNKIILQ